MLCRICNTQLPNEAVCCFRCGTFTQEINQVLPLSLDETETVVRPSAVKLAPSENFNAAESRKRKLKTVDLIFLLVFLVFITPIFIGQKNVSAIVNFLRSFF